MLSSSPLFISAAHKSSGKTTITIGLCSALSQTGLIVQPFKKGPDYIDPLWHGQAAQACCYTLDYNTMSSDEILSLYQQKAAPADISIVEGNKGLYDGLDLDGSNSNAAIAKLLDAKVILVLDARGMTRGIAPLILGYQAFDADINIAGVILNQLGGSRHEAKLRAVIEYYTDVAVLGAIHRKPELEIVERHLGLMPSNEDNQANDKIFNISQQIKEQVDLDKIVSITRTPPQHQKISSGFKIKTRADTTQKPVKIAIIKDEAFGFYYPGDMEALQLAGADLIPVNAIKDNQLPENIDALFIGGGFPELHMHALAANQSFMTHIAELIERGIPAYAECGGLMYLCRSLLWNEKSAEMVGIINADVEMKSKPQGRGLIRFNETSNMLWPTLNPNKGEDAQKRTISAHEFHYSKLTNLSKDTQFAYKITRGMGIDGENDGIVYKNLLASYAHLQNTQQNLWAERFVQFIRSTIHKSELF